MVAEGSREGFTSAVKPGSTRKHFALRFAPHPASSVSDPLKVIGRQAPVTVATILRSRHHRDTRLPALCSSGIIACVTATANEICLHQTFKGINTRLARRSVIHIRDPGVVDEHVVANSLLDSSRASRTYAANEANPIASHSGSLDSGPDMVLHRSDRPIQLCVASAGSCEDGSFQLD
jgi:hypothetical protein